MSGAAALEQPSDSRWSPSVKAVQRALVWIKGRGFVTPAELVAWDRAHGKRLFDWDDASAAESWRIQQARLFLNSFASKLDGARIRAFISMPADADEENPVEERRYLSVETISTNERLRARAIQDIMRRMERLAKQLSTFWHVSDAEREDLIERLRQAMAPAQL